MSGLGPASPAATPVKSGLGLGGADTWSFLIETPWFPMRVPKMWLAFRALPT